MEEVKDLISKLSQRVETLEKIQSPSSRFDPSKLSTAELIKQIEIENTKHLSFLVLARLSEIIALCHQECTNGFTK